MAVKSCGLSEKYQWGTEGGQFICPSAKTNQNRKLVAVVRAIRPTLFYREQNPTFRSPDGWRSPLRSFHPLELCFQGQCLAVDCSNKAKTIYASRDWRKEGLRGWGVWCRVVVSGHLATGCNRDLRIRRRGIRKTMYPYVHAAGLNRFIELYQPHIRIFIPILKSMSRTPTSC
ncbi:hypothetical protein CCHR01_16861 [Colletotrichum chrysophilum]|uniref:Uncharacterized protein n=1 Tax=Colletotrichum chrysophilum TaxID=1836956 RepID=A0AAD9E7F4_9PEZI|nr:hypothetical protein CCHR01_16861 [Colletotrichum chrysophilum]